MNRQDMQLGQMFMVGFDGMTVDADHPVVEEIVRHRLGGIILFDRNVDGSAGRTSAHRNNSGN